MEHAQNVHLFPPKTDRHLKIENVKQTQANADEIRSQNVVNSVRLKRKWKGQVSNC